MHGFLLGTYLALCAGDASSTAIALRSGAREVVQTQSPAANGMIIAGEGAAMTLAYKRLHERHPKVWITLSVAGIAVRGWAVAHNVQVARGMR